tara:strand:- start:4147 stop:7278 length:3132 start_codon:yes stop_codon:yes gene_type:complete
MHSFFKKSLLITLITTSIVNAQITIDSTYIYTDKKQYDKALKFASTNNDYISLIENGVKLYNEGLYDTSLDFLLKAIQISENKISIEDKINIQGYISGLYIIFNDFKKSLEYTTANKKLIEKYYGVESIEGIQIRNTLGGLFCSAGEYSEAEKVLLYNLEIAEKTLNKNNPNYAKTLDNLADLYLETDKYDLYQFYFKKYFKISKKVLNKNTRDYLNLLNSKLKFDRYNQVANIEEIKLIREIANCSKKVYGETSLNYLVDLNNLAIFYISEGTYKLSESITSEVLALTKRTFGEKHFYYLSTLEQLSNIFLSQGKNRLAEQVLLKVSRIIKGIHQEQSIEYANIHVSLGDFYNEINIPSKTNSYYNKALNIYKLLLNTNHQDYLNLLQKLSKYYADVQDFSRAEILYLELIEIQKENLGVGSRDFNFLLIEIGNFYFKNKNYTKAIHYTQMILENQENSDRKSKFNVNGILGDYHRNAKSFDKASFYFQKSISIDYTLTLESIYNMSESEILTFMNSNRTNLGFKSSLSFIHDFPNYYPKLNTSVFNYELLIKNSSLNNLSFLKNTIVKSTNKTLKSKYQILMSNKAKLYEEKELPSYKRSKKFKSIKFETEQIEKELLTKQVPFKNFKKQISPSWLNLKSSLKNKEIIIYLVSIEYRDESFKYGAFIIKNNFKTPKFIQLFEEQQLEQLILKTKKQSDSTQINQQYIGKSISDLFLKPLEKELKNIKTIYLSLSGLGHQVDFSALPISDQQTFGEKYNVHILSSPSELIGFKPSKLNKSSIEILLYGGIDYNKSKESVSSDARSLNDTIYSDLATRSGIKNFSYLNGTNKEIESITLSATQNGFKTTPFTERLATETSIKKLDGKTQPFVLHLATHGFFFPDQEKDISQGMLVVEGKREIYKRANDPMMRSGLLFAGANKFWGKPNDNQNKEDGILTASEISNLDLSACELVVLSACETGLGKVQGSEGVFGLQRAFKMAGVKNIIMSLWKVPDAQTAELFDIFYEECFKGKSIHKAFQTAQSTMKEKYSPYFWAGFVLLE